MDLDEKDLSILRCLQDDALMGYADIGEEIGMSASGVFRRIKALKENDYILSSRATLNHRKLGFDIVYYIVLQLRSHHSAANQAFKQEIRGKFPNIIECSKVSGTWDYVLKVVARDTADYDRIACQLKDLPSVRLIRGFHVTDDAVTSGIPLPDAAPPDQP